MKKFFMGLAFLLKPNSSPRFWGFDLSPPLGNKYLYKKLKIIISFLFILSIFFLFCSPGYAGATTYYVDSNRPDDTGNGLTWATAKKYISTAYTLVSAGDTIEVSGGTYYNIYLNRDHAPGIAENPVTIKGSSAVGHNGEVIIISPNPYRDSIYIGDSYVVLQNLTVKDAPNGHYNILIADNLSGVVLDRLKVMDGYLQLYAGNQNGLLIKNCIFEGTALAATQYGYGYDFKGGTGTIENSIFRASEKYPNLPIRFYWVPGVNFTNFNIYNSLIIGSRSEAIVVRENSTLNIKNSIIFGHQKKDNWTYIINNFGTTNLSNSLWLPNWQTSYNLKGVNESNNINNQLPKFVSSRRQGIASLTIDDADLTYWENFASTIVPYGYKLTAMTTTAWLTSAYPDYQTRLQALVNEGHEIGLHTYSHPTLTTTNAFNIQYTGAEATCTMTVAANQFSTSCGADSINALSFTNTNYDTIKKICNYVDGLNNYICTINSGIANLTLSTSLADVYSQNIKSLFTAQLNQLRFFNDEIVNPKAWLESVIGGGYVVKSFAYPFGNHNTAVEDGVKNAGLLGARGDSGDYGDYHLENLSAFTVKSFNVYLFNIESEVFSYCADAQEHAYFVGLVFHNAQGHPLSAVDQIASAFSKCSDISVMTFGEAMTYIRTSGLWTDANGDGKRWTRTYNDNSNYHLQSTSPLIDAGTDIGLTTDKDGNPIYGAPDIGPYEFQPPYTIGTDRVDITGSIRIYADGKYRYITAPSNGTMADISITPSGGWGSGDYSKWMDVSISTWNISGTYYKKWTETTFNAMTTVHGIGDLKANTYYTVLVDGGILNTYLSDALGKITFSYTYNVSASKEFEVIEKDTIIAFDDAYSVAEDTTLNVAVPGVVQNDRDATGGGILSAAIVSGVSHGFLTLNSNGSFSYIPNANYYGSDSFTYKAVDGTVESNVATVSIIITPVNDPPISNPGGPYSGIEGQAITLDGSASSDIDGSVVLYEWDINNDGIYEYSSSSPTQSHTYTQQGTYTIKLRVIDNNGATGETTTTASILDTSPAVDFTGTPTNGTAPLTVNFSNTSAGYDQPLSYEWDFDNNGIIDSTAQSPSYNYTNPGTYTVKLKVTDSDGSINSLIMSNYITVCSSLLPVRISGVSPVYFPTLQSAYAAVNNGDTIQSQAVVFNENLNLNLNKSVTMVGGYNCDYTTISGRTTLNGTLTDNDGIAIIENFIVQ